MSNLQSTELTAATERIKLRLRRTAEDIIAIGHDLLTIKGQLPHGQFLPWIEQHFEMNEQSARRFMQVADRFEGKSNIMLDLKPTILYELAAPSTPPEVVTEVTAKVEAGESVSIAEVKALKRKLKESEQQLKETEEAKQRALQESRNLNSTVQKSQQAQTEAIEEIDRLTDELEKLSVQIEGLQNQAPEVVEKEVIKEVEVIPEGYTSAQEALEALQQQSKVLTDQILEHRTTLAKLKQQSSQDGKIADLRRELRIMCGHLDKAFAQIADRQTLVLADPLIQTDAGCQEYLKQAHATLLHWVTLLQNAGQSVNITPKGAHTIQVLPVETGRAEA